MGIITEEQNGQDVTLKHHVAKTFMYSNILVQLSCIPCMIYLQNRMAQITSANYIKNIWTKYMYVYAYVKYPKYLKYI